jgi:(p)ppGpp synthase/HD superfamily hydrolase
MTQDFGDHSRILSLRFEEALVYAAQLHANQVRKGTEVPYIAHLLAVASIVLEHGGNEYEAIAALLHDAIEDQGLDATRQEIKRRFGDRVVEIVDGCTDSDVLPKPPWKCRKQKHIDHLRGASRSILLVSAAEKLHNARAILAGLSTTERIAVEPLQRTQKRTVWYYRALVRVYRQAGSHTALIDELT